MAESVDFELNATGDLETRLSRAASEADSLASAIDEVTGEAKALDRVDLDNLERSLEGVDAAADDAGDSLASIASVAAGGVLAGMFDAAVEKAKELVGWVAETASEVERTTRQSRGMLDAISGGDGERIFQGLSDLAKGLGADVNDLTADFVSFVEGGLSEVEAVSLIRLKEDIEAVTGSSEMADQAIAKLNAEVAAGASFEASLRSTADAYNVIGDGSEAAAAKTRTLSGALDNFSARVGDAFQKALDGSGAELSSFGDALGRIASSEAFISAIEAGVQAVTVMAMALADLVDWIDETGEEGSDAAVELDIVTGVLSGLASAVAWPINMFNQLMDVWSGVKALAGIVGSALSSGVDAVMATLGKWVSAGGDIITGLIDGIKNKIGDLVAAAGEMADKAVATIKSKLKISSPSKVFEEMGAFTVEGFEQGLRPVDVGEAMFPGAVDSPANDVAPPAVAGGGSTINVTINVDGAGGDADGIAVAVRRELEDYLSTIALGVGT